MWLIIQSLGIQLVLFVVGIFKMKYKEFVLCNCGAKVYGRSKVHAQSNLPKHKESKRHKEFMELKNG